MPPVVLMRGIALTTGFSTSAAVLIVDRNLEIDFDLTCSAGPSTVKYFIQYSEDLVTWYDEVAEENAGHGVVSMPKALRTFADNGSTGVANNTNFRVTCPFTRPHQFARIQIAATVGTVVVNSAVAAYGLGPYGSVVIGTSVTPPPPVVYFGPDNHPFSYGASHTVVNSQLASFLVPFNTIPNVMLGLILSTINDDMWLSGSGLNGKITIGLDLNPLSNFPSIPLWQLSFGNSGVQEGIVSRTSPCQDADPPFDDSGGDCDPLASFGVTAPVMPAVGALASTRTVPFMNPNPAGAAYIIVSASATGILHTGIYNPTFTIVAFP